MDDVNVAIELENDVVFVRHRLPGILWKYGIGLKSLHFMRKNVLRMRSEQLRRNFKDAASYLLSDRPGTGELTEIII